VQALIEPSSSVLQKPKTPATGNDPTAAIGLPQTTIRGPAVATVAHQLPAPATTYKPIYKFPVRPQRQLTKT